MSLFSKEYYELLEQFERDSKSISRRSLRYDKEKKEFWQIGRIYQSEETNELFRLYSTGYSFGKSATII